MKGFFFIAVVLLFSLPVEGAVISGTLYDLSLEPMNNVVVEVNTTPHQIYLSKDGSYSFNMPQGSYQIQAQHMHNGRVDYSAEETILVEKEGSYIIDLFLFYNLEGDEQDLNISEIEFTPVYFDNAWNYQLLAVVIIMLLVVFGAVLVGRYVRRRKKPDSSTKEPPEEHLTPEQETLLALVKKHQGIATQKDLRKGLPLSEAKVSLLITDLEARGYIQKIKKGRTNIVKYIKSPSKSHSKSR